MIKISRVLMLMPLLSIHAGAAGELGTGRENDIPDATPPTEPASSEAPDDVLQELFDWFDADVEQ